MLNYSLIIINLLIIIEVLAKVEVLVVISMRVNWVTEIKLKF